MKIRAQGKKYIYIFFKLKKYILIIHWYFIRINILCYFFEGQILFKREREKREGVLNLHKP